MIQFVLILFFSSILLMNTGKGGGNQEGKQYDHLILSLIVMILI